MYVRIEDDEKNDEGRVTRMTGLMKELIVDGCRIIFERIDDTVDGRMYDVQNDK
jgi:hypothetical protein